LLNNNGTLFALENKVYANNGTLFALENKVYANNYNSTMMEAKHLPLQIQSGGELLHRRIL